MPRPAITYRANGRLPDKLNSRYEPHLRRGKVYPAERKGLQEAARGLRQMTARATRVAS